MRNSGFCLSLLLLLWSNTTALGQSAPEGEVFDPSAPPGDFETELLRFLRPIKCAEIRTDVSRHIEGIDFRDGLEGRTVTLKDLEHLPSKHRYKAIFLPSEANVTDEWLEVLAKFHGLKKLFVQNGKITSDGLANLKNLKMEFANLSECENLSDASMETIANWSDLQTLYLADLPISDDATEVIATLKKLTLLDISSSKAAGNAVTNNSVRILKKMATLKELYIEGTQIDSAGVTELRAALPRCDIIGK